ncbi:MAG: MBL fold metallo-hydrolase [Bacillota bacterium]
MIIECIPTGMYGSNCYIAGDNGEGIIIDAGVGARDIMAVVEKNNLKIKYIILTHAHIDHICQVDEVREKTGAKVLIHENDSPKLTNPVLNGSILFGSADSYKPADSVVHDGDELEAGGIKFEIIHTPGHSSGSICIKTGNVIFTGDTLFNRGIGRTDLGDGDMGTILDSISKKLMRYSDDTVVYPGHGASTTIGAERGRFNY